MSEINEIVKGVLVRLNPDQAMNPYRIKYPITWIGRVGNHEVEIIQNTQSSKFIEGYNFKIFQSEHNDIQSDIIKVIDDYLRILD